VLAGWTDYPYPESIYAAQQAGVPMTTPLLSRACPDGTWKPLGEIGFPAGLPRVMTVAVPDLAGDASCRLRIQTNLQIFWDQIFLAPVSDQNASPRDRALKVQSLPLSQATLAMRGFMREASVNGAFVYDDQQTEPVAVTRWRGQLTSAGDVTKQLQSADDELVVCGPGAEITVQFDASRLAPLAEGQERSFVLRTRGFCKDASPFTLTGGDVGPLPRREMKKYPP
jgi:hypothetical protein